MAGHAFASPHVVRSDGGVPWYMRTATVSPMGDPPDAIAMHPTSPVTAQRSHHGLANGLLAPAVPHGFQLPPIPSTRDAHPLESTSKTGIDGTVTVTHTIPKSARRTLSQTSHVSSLTALDKRFDSDDLTKHDYELAAAAVEDALAGRLNHGKASLMKKPLAIQNCFAIQTNKWFAWCIYILIMFHSLIIIAEPPTTHQQWWTQFVCALCIIVYIFDVTLKMIYMGVTDYFSKTWHRVQCALIIAYIVDFGLSFSTPLFPLRCLRPVLLVVRNREMRRVFDVIQVIIPRLGKVLAGIVGFILFFAVIGVHLFSEQYNAPYAKGQYRGAFDNVPAAALRLFSLLTSENYPEVMMPAAVDDPSYMIFFAVFVYIGSFLVMSMLLAIVVDSYWTLTKHQVASEKRKERQGLVKAFVCLDKKASGCIGFRAFRGMYRVLRHKASDPEIRFRFELLERTGTGALNTIDFFAIGEVMQLSVQKVEHVDRLHRPVYATIKARCVAYTSSKISEKVPVVLIAVLCVLYACYWRGMSLATLRGIFAAETLIGVLSACDVFARIIAHGREFLSFSRRIGDLTITMFSLLFFMLYWVGKWEMATVILAPAFVIARLFWSSRVTRQAAVVCLRILPVMIDLSWLIGVVMYFYASVGMSAFDDVQMTDLQYVDIGCRTSFMSFGCAILALFQVVVGNNWNDVMHSLIDTEGYGAAAFYISFVVVVDFVMLNLLIAIAIEAFFNAKKMTADDLTTHEFFVHDSPEGSESASEDGENGENGEVNIDIDFGPNGDGLFDEDGNGSGSGGGGGGHTVLALNMDADDDENAASMSPAGGDNDHVDRAPNHAPRESDVLGELVSSIGGELTDSMGGRKALAAVRRMRSNSEGSKTKFRIHRRASSSWRQEIVGGGDEQRLDKSELEKLSKVAKVDLVNMYRAAMTGSLILGSTQDVAFGDASAAGGESADNDDQQQRLGSAPDAVRTYMMRSARRAKTAVAERRGLMVPQLSAAKSQSFGLASEEPSALSAANSHKRSNSEPRLRHIVSLAVAANAASPTADGATLVDRDPFGAVQKGDARLSRAPVAMPVVMQRSASSAAMTRSASYNAMAASVTVKEDSEATNNSNSKGHSNGDGNVLSRVPSNSNGEEAAAAAAAAVLSDPPPPERVAATVTTPASTLPPIFSRPVDVSVHDALPPDAMAASGHGSFLSTSIISNASTTPMLDTNNSNGGEKKSSKRRRKRHEDKDKTSVRDDADKSDAEAVAKEKRRELRRLKKERSKSASADASGAPGGTGGVAVGTDADSPAKVPKSAKEKRRRKHTAIVTPMAAAGTSGDGSAVGAVGVGSAGDGAGQSVARQTVADSTPARKRSPPADGASSSSPVESRSAASMSADIRGAATLDGAAS